MSREIHVDGVDIGSLYDNDPDVRWIDVSLVVDDVWYLIEIGRLPKNHRWEMAFWNEETDLFCWSRPYPNQGWRKKDVHRVMSLPPLKGLTAK